MIIFPADSVDTLRAEGLNATVCMMRFDAILVGERMYLCFLAGCLDVRNCLPNPVVGGALAWYCFHAVNLVKRLPVRPNPLRFW